MSRLRIFNENDPATPLLATSDRAEMAAELANIDVAFEPAELYSRYRGLRQVGTGVGLALVGRLADRLGGTASAGHAPEGGACFRVSLPGAGGHTPPA